MSLALIIGNAGGAFWRARSTLAQPWTAVLSAASMSFSNAPPTPPPVIGSGGLTVTTGGALPGTAGVTTTVEPGLRTASTSACCFSVGAWVPERKSRARASTRPTWRLP